MARFNQLNAIGGSVDTYNVTLTDVRKGTDENTHLIPVPSGKTARVYRGGVHDDQGNTPSGLTLSLKKLGSTAVVSTTSRSETFNETVSGPETLVINVDNATGSDISAGGQFKIAID